MNRSLELLCAAVGLVLLSPLAVVLATLIRVTTPGPAVFTQIRVGRHGQPFRCYKFRSMYVGTPELPTHESKPGDVTPAGRFLRAFKLDEFPQLVNVVRGDMSLVGPRPCLPAQIELIEARRARGVLALRPGITGLAQVHGIDMSDPVRLAEVDALYACRRGFITDVRILCATVLGVRALAPYLAERKSG